MSKIITKPLYDLDDITIVPECETFIRHRSDCKVTYDDGNLPIFVSPMDTVVNADNFQTYLDNQVTPILPRTEPIETRIEFTKSGYWVAYGLDEFERLFCNYHSEIDPQNCKGQHFHVLIDIANGHIVRHLCGCMGAARELASKYGYEITFMVGNIANPETFKRLAEAGADYVRCSIGSGGLCLTSANCAVHYPMASLLNECREIKEENNYKTAIIADGGISSYSRAIKALACGADYIMIGSVFGKCFESAGDVVSAQLPQQEMVDGLTLNDINRHRRMNDLSEEKKKYYIGMKLQKVIYGMSTKRAQKAINGPDCKLKTSEGLEKTVTIEYTLHQWLDNFVAYLRSAMSYTDSRDLYEFETCCQLQVMTSTAQRAFNK